MFFDPATNTAFGNLGWVDKGSLWSCEVGTGVERRLPVANAEFLNVRRHGPGLIRLLHHGQVAGASIRACNRPDVELASLRFGADGWSFCGDNALWGESLALLMMTASGRSDLLLVDGAAERVRSLDLSWYNPDAYDLGYQGLVDCLALPQAGVVVVSVQRSSDLVLINVERNAHDGVIRLTGVGGNPRLRKLSATEVFASDYDVLCRVDVESRRVQCSGTLQPPASPNTHQFIGDYDFSETACAVARPYSGDVLKLDVESFAVLASAPVKGRPLRICLTSDTAFVTRDWKTGKVERGQFS